MITSFLFSIWGNAKNSPVVWVHSLTPRLVIGCLKMVNPEMEDDKVLEDCPRF